MAAAPRAASVMRTFMSTWRARRLKKAARALQLDGAVGAIHAGDVQHAALGAVLPGERRQQIELTVVVDRDGAMVGAVCLDAGATREGANVFGVQRRLVEADVEKAARDVRLDGVHAIEAAQLAADLVHALAALRLPRQQHRQLEGLLRHRAPSSAGSASFGARAASPARPSVL